jgi:hypothetical protein
MMRERVEMRAQSLGRVVETTVLVGRDATFIIITRAPAAASFLTARIVPRFEPDTGERRSVAAVESL